MSTTISIERPILTKDELLVAWQGHRKLTRRVIEIFPEKDLFNFSIGGMRPFAELCREIIAVAAGSMQQIVTGNIRPLEECMPEVQEKADILESWDQTTDIINASWSQIQPERFREEISLFGAYNMSVIGIIQYAIDNEIHHRGQGYVYLRVLGIEPPFFWERF